MEKTLVKLSVPAIQKTFDLFVPSEIPIGTLIQVIVNGVEELNPGRYIVSHQEMLIRKAPDVLLNPEKELGSYSIKDGTELVLL